MFSSLSVKDGGSTAQSINILTWQQMVGDEKAKNIFPAIVDVFEMKKKIREDGGIPELPNVKLELYDIHDSKMLYMLT